MRILAFVFLLGLAFAEDKVSYEGYQVITLKPSNTAELDLLTDLESSEEFNVEYWTEPNVQGPRDVQVAPESLESLKVYLDESGIEYEVAIENLQTLIDNEEQENNRLTMDAEVVEGVTNVLGRYARHTELMAWVDSLARQYPTLCKTESIGRSYEGRDIRLLTISSGGSKPAIFVNSMIHAREWIVAGSVTHVINALLTTSDGQRLVNAFDWYFVPVSNPDGYEYSFSRDRMWRKTRSPNAGTSCRGSDANRNWDFYFGQAGVSRNPCAATWPGPYAFSEVETRSVRDAILARASRMIMFLDMHSFSQLWLTPYGAIRTRPSDGAEQDLLGNVAAMAIRATHGRTYRVGTPPQLLYAASGGAFDWAKGKAGIKYSFAPELRPATARQGGFILPPSQIVPNGQEIWAAFVAIADSLISKDYHY